MPTALQIAQTRQTRFTAGLIMALYETRPLFSNFDFRTEAGYDFLSLALIKRANGASFTQYGKGFEHTDSAFELRNFSSSLIGGLVKSEVITENRWNQSNSVIGYEWFDLQTRHKFESSMLNLERQMILGRAFDPDGFPGAKELTPFVAGNVFTMAENGAKYNYARSVLNAGGTVNGTASSVYGFVFGEMDCQGVICGGDTSGEFLTLDEVVTQMLPPDPIEPAKLSSHHVAQMAGHIGLSVAGSNTQSEGQTIPVQYSLRRIANLTEEEGKTLTDKHMVKFTRSFGTGKRPNLIAMSERSGEQLAASRAPVAVHFNMGAGDAATNQANQYPDPPEDWRGIQIVYPDPDVISDQDAIEV